MIFKWYISNWKTGSRLLFDRDGSGDDAVTCLILFGLVGNKGPVRPRPFCVEIINTGYENKQKSGPDTKTPTAGFGRDRKPVAGSQLIPSGFFAKCHSLLPQIKSMTIADRQITKIKQFGETSFEKICLTVEKTFKINKWVPNHG